MESAQPLQATQAGGAGNGAPKGAVGAQPQPQSRRTPQPQPQASGGQGTGAQHAGGTSGGAQGGGAKKGDGGGASGPTSAKKPKTGRDGVQPAAAPAAPRALRLLAPASAPGAFLLGPGAFPLGPPLGPPVNVEEAGPDTCCSPRHPPRLTPSDI
jgi:hypothetical protein